jgi:hypothetical protein
LAFRARMPPTSTVICRGGRFVSLKKCELM